MDVADRIWVHQARCQPYLLQLRILAGDQAGAAPARQVAAEVTQATAAILAEVAATAQMTAATAAGAQRGQGAAALLEARLARLRAAADATIAAAWEEDAARLRHQVRRFEALITAMWTVQHAMSGALLSAKPAVRKVPA